MVTIALVKFIHVICAVTFFGGLIGSYFYTSMQSEGEMQAFIFKNTAKIDLVLFIPMMFIAAATGSVLVWKGVFTFRTPWIIGAYSLLAAVFILILMSHRYKKKRLKNKIYHATNILMIILLAIIAHDAVMKHSMFDYVLR